MQRTKKQKCIRYVFNIYVFSIIVNCVFPRDFGMLVSYESPSHEKRLKDACFLCCFL